jgi:hypothetical protein
MGFALFIIYALIPRWPWDWGQLVTPGPDKRVGAVLFLHRIAADLIPNLTMKGSN